MRNKPRPLRSRAKAAAPPSRVRKNRFPARNATPMASAPCIKACPERRRRDGFLPQSSHPDQGLSSSRTANDADRELGYPLPVGGGKGEGPLSAALFFSAEPQNFDAWRPSYTVTAPDAKVPHPALRSGLSRRREVIHDPSLGKSTVSGQGEIRGGEQAAEPSSAAG